MNKQGVEVLFHLFLYCNDLLCYRCDSFLVKYLTSRKAINQMC